MAKMSNKKKRQKWLADLRYRQTPKGCLMRAYQYAERRVTKGTAKYGPSTVGMALCPREMFYEAFLNDPAFLKLYEAWAAGGFKKMERPTPDRQDTSRGYMPNNIRWATYQANTYRALGV